ncbi:hypothetical protein F5141DRAFT_1120303 [Pisolithus sp. B1]|nr:hypothetical protein F5141DRAFT_1120303 [Pisolithus sp. B1]
MFKRVEKRRKRRDEEERLGLDEETKEILGLNETDSDESDTGSESGEDDRAGDDLLSPISIEEALKNPVYLISLDPTVHGCILCKGKIIKNAEMAVVHKGSVVLFTCFFLTLDSMKALCA